MEVILSYPVLTLDIDWAPDFVIDEVAGLLLAAGVKATWFVTHDSPAVRRLGERPDLFELGLHPNFLSPSSHGTNPAAVIAHCSALVPDATSIRTHGLMQSTNLLDQIFTLLPRLETDLSLFLPRAKHVEPLSYRFGNRIVSRLPYVWEDDMEMIHDDPWWSLKDCTGIRGLTIFDFHPIHVFMNAPDFGPYTQLKKNVASLTSARPKDIPVRDGSQPGPGGLFRQIIAHLANAGRSYRVRDLTESAKMDTAGR